MSCLGGRVHGSDMGVAYLSRTTPDFLGNV
jgi:hypothetical protein